MDGIAGVPTTAAGFDMIQNHVDILSGKVHAVPTRATATAAHGGRCRDHPRHVSPVWSRVPRRARGGSRWPKLRPRWDGPFRAFTVTACPSPNPYTLALPRKMRPTVNVDRLKPFFERADEPPGPVSDAGQAGEHELGLLLNRRAVCGVTEYLVCWRGHASPADAGGGRSS